MSLRIGVLGASRIAEAAIVGPAAELGHRLVAVAARDRSRAEVFAEKYGVERVLDGYQAVIDDPEVDVVYNPLANSLHAPWNLAAIAAGKPVLSEKPFARDASEARLVAEAADAAGVTVLEGFHYFFHPVTQRAFELAGDGTIGEITHVEVRMAMPAPGDDDPRWSLELAGGALMDLGCYGLHVMRSLGRLAMPGIEGRPSIVRAHAEQRTPGVDAWCDVEFGFPGGATGLSTHSMVGDALLVPHPDRRHGRRSPGARLHQAQRGRPADDQHSGGHRGRAPRHQGVLHLPVGGLRRTRAAGHAAAVRHGRRGGEHGLHRRGVPRGRNGAPMRSQNR